MTGLSTDRELLRLGRHLNTRTMRSKLMTAADTYPADATPKTAKVPPPANTATRAILNDPPTTPSTMAL
jgi:hypothetical protein